MPFSLLSLELPSRKILHCSKLVIIHPNGWKFYPKRCHLPSLWKFYPKRCNLPSLWILNSRSFHIVWFLYYRSFHNIGISILYDILLFSILHIKSSMCLYEFSISLISSMKKNYEALGSTVIISILDMTSKPHLIIQNPADPHCYVTNATIISYL